MPRLSPFTGLAGLVFLAACQSGPPPHTAERVDMKRYAGRWYEVARIPVWFEDGWLGVTADYTPSADGTTGTIAIARIKKDGKTKQIEADARVIDPPANTRLKVMFFWPFEWDYWILRLDKDYRFVAVGSPNRQLLWLLSRTPAMDEETYRDMTESLRTDGFDVDRLEKTPPGPQAP